MGIGRFELPSNWESYARNVRAQFLITLDPMEFLELTTPSGTWRNKIYNENRFTYAEYLKFKNQTDPPELWLKFPGKDPDGLPKICDHEGRHRAVAYSRAGGKEFQAIVIVKPTEFHEKMADRIAKKIKRMFKPHEAVSFDDVPKRVIAQYETKWYDTDTWKLQKALV